MTSVRFNNDTHTREALRFNSAREHLTCRAPRTEPHLQERDAVDGSVDESDVSDWFPLEIHSLCNLVVGEEKAKENRDRRIERPSFR